MAKIRLRPKKEAKKTATEFSKKYNIEYSSGGDTFQIYLKGDDSKTPIKQSKLLGETEGKL